MTSRHVLARLGLLLSSRLDALVPTGLRVEALDCGVVVWAPGQTQGRTVDLSPLLRPGDDADRDLFGGVLQVQDEVIEPIRSASPADENHAAPASAFSERCGDELRLGYRWDDRTPCSSRFVGTSFADDAPARRCRM